MNLKKILSAILIGAFTIGVPAANFDTPLTKTVYAGYGLFAQRKAELEAELNRARLNYEHRENYERAVKSGKYSDSEIKNLKDKYLKAKKDYEHKKEILEKYQRDLEKTKDKTPKFDGIG